MKRKTHPLYSADYRRRIVDLYRTRRTPKQLARRQAYAHRETTPVVPGCALTAYRHQAQRGQQPDAVELHQAPAALIGARLALDLAVLLRDTPIQIA